MKQTATLVGGLFTALVFTAVAQASSAPPASPATMQRPAPEMGARQDTGSVLDRRLTLDLDTTLVAALDEVTRLAHLDLSYTDEVVPAGRHVTIKVTEVTVREVLKRVLKGTGAVVHESPSGALTLVKESEWRPGVGGIWGGGIWGYVSDAETHQPLARAQLVVLRTSLSAVTNGSGWYSLPGAPVGRVDSVMARLVGYKPTVQAVMLADSQIVQMDFKLHRAPTRLSDLVTTATGQRRRIELGNDITILNADSIVATQPVSSITELLATRVPGLIVLHTSGAPGDPARLRFRGASSINRSNDPVIIVDGVRIYYAQSDPRSQNLANLPGVGSPFAAPSPLDQIDPNSVETVEVFKGPSAATMYGPDAANGVIVITTKKGKPGPPRWTASVERGLTSMPGRYPEEYLRWGHLVGNAFVASNSPMLCRLGNPFCVADSLVTFQALNDPTTTLFGQGNRTATTVGVSGGASALTYALTASVVDQTGLLQLPSLVAQRFVSVHGTTPPDWMQRPQALSRWSVTNRLGAQLGSKADISLSTLLTNERQQRSSLEGLLGSLAGAYVDRATGTYYLAGDNGLPSPDLLSGFYTQGTDEATNFTSTLTLSWHPAGWLTTSANAGLNVIGRLDQQLLPRGMSTALDSVGAVSIGHGSTLLKSLNLQATATAPLALGFRLQAAFGANFTGTSIADLKSDGTDLPLGVNSLNRARWHSTSESQSDLATFGWYVEPSLNNSRLFLSTGLRLDGGSSYGVHARLAGFPKVSVSYLVSDERWFPHVLMPVFTTLRLRAAYGHAGVEPGIGDALRLFTQGNGLLDGHFVDVATLATLGNTRISPERSTEVEGGFDADLFGDRTSVSLSRYRKMRYDALMAIPVAPSVNGGGIITRNIGTIRNTGLELTLGTQLVRSDLITWHTSLGLSRNRNQVVALNGGAPLDLGNAQRVVAGYPLFGFWAKPILGYTDANQDGVIEPGEVLVGDSTAFMGSTDPKYRATLGTTLSVFHGAVSIDASLDYQNGLTQLNDMPFSGFSRARNDPTAPFGMQATAVTTSGDPGSLAGFAGGISTTPYGLFETVSTLRFNSLSVAYRLPARLARRLGASGISLALQGTNLGLWTNYRGKDPDVNAYATGNNVADTGILPVPRTWQVRLNVSY